MKKEFSIAVLISGRGSNLEALLKSQDFYQIKAVISDKVDAAGLKIASAAGVPVVESFSRENYPSKQSQKQAIYSRIYELKPDLICLAGFMQILDSEFVKQFYGKLINIHPSLLPELPGLNTHARALELKLGMHGCSVHFVDSGLDSGPIIAQAQCPILKDDNEQTLAARVLALEHKLYPWVVSAIAKDDIWLEKSEEDENGITKFNKIRVEQGLELGYIFPSIIFLN